MIEDVDLEMMESHMWRGEGCVRHQEAAFGGLPT